VATLELADPAYAEYIGQVEVGDRVAGHLRVAFEVRTPQRSPRPWPVD
jgi:lactoylglutathione lyase